MVVREKPFEYLRQRGNNLPYPEDIIRNWYVARAYILFRLKDIAIGPDSTHHLHMVINGDSPLMLAVLRQAALSSHFINYKENDTFGQFSTRNRTVLTLVTRMETDEVIRVLKKEEHLCNLPDFCHLSVFGELRNEDSWLDIQLQIVHERPEESDTLWIEENDILSFVGLKDPEEIFSIDTRKAVFANRAYELGAVIDNLPAEDIHNAKRYARALDTFQYRLLQSGHTPLIKEDYWSKNQVAVINGLSSLFCSDCFVLRAAGIRQYAQDNNISEQSAWEKCCESLSRSEHARWAVEKLIMGFRPLTNPERLHYEGLFGKERATFVSSLKTKLQNPAHIDLCSYRDLRRIDPESLKYDSFLMLGIPVILTTVK